MVSLMCVCVAELCFVCCVFVMCALESFGAGASIVPAAEVPAGWWAFDMWMCVVVLEYVCLLVPVNYQRRYSLGNGGPFDVCVCVYVCVRVCTVLGVADRSACGRRAVLHHKQICAVAHAALLHAIKTGPV